MSMIAQIVMVYRNDSIQDVVMVRNGTFTCYSQASGRLLGRLEEDFKLLSPRTPTVGNFVNLFASPTP